MEEHPQHLPLAVELAAMLTTPKNFWGVYLTTVLDKTGMKGGCSHAR